jgi:hypothetical protein
MQMGVQNIGDAALLQPVIEHKLRAHRLLTGYSTIEKA